MRLWKAYCPGIVIRSSMSDVCDECSAYYQDPANAVDIEEHHVAYVTERIFYRESQTLARSQPNTLHVSLDFAQNLKVPFSPIQAGSIYFKTGINVSIFGLVLEGAADACSKTLIISNECNDVGKGPSVVISYLHHQLSISNKPDLIINMDNCGGQNKNNLMMWYLAWRVFNGLNNSIHVHFLVRGHTKFSPDALFGTTKQMLKNKDLDSIDDICEELDTHFPEVLVLKDQVPIYNFAQYFEPSRADNGRAVNLLKKIPSLSTYRHFRFDAASPMHVSLFTEATDECRSGRGGLDFSFRGRGVNASAAALRTQFGDLSTERLEQFIVTPEGLSPERQWYLYDKLRDHARPESREAHYPLPNVPRPGRA